MRNTGIEYTSAERTPTILPDLAELLPPLSGEQLAALEKDILQNGCYAPIIVNEDLGCRRWPQPPTDLHPARPALQDGGVCL